MNTDLPISAIVALVEYIEHDEREHFEEMQSDGSDTSNHIYNSVKAVALWLDGQGINRWGMGCMIEHLDNTDARPNPAHSKRRKVTDMEPSGELAEQARRRNRRRATAARWRRAHARGRQLDAPPDCLLCGQQLDFNDGFGRPKNWQRIDSRYCSNACRQKAYRARLQLAQHRRRRSCC
jgi:hypothetical protein